MIRGDFKVESFNLWVREDDSSFPHAVYIYIYVLKPCYFQLFSQSSLSTSTLTTVNERVALKEEAFYHQNPSDTL